MAAPSRPPAMVPFPNVTFDGNNYREWSTMLWVCLDSHRLWVHLTGRSPCPSVPVRPAEPPAGVDGAPPFAQAMVDYTRVVEQYMFDLSDYEDWTAAEARATQILLGSMKVEFAMDIAHLPSTQAMWERAQALYQPSSHVLYISTLELTSSLRQQDSSVDTFYHQLIDVWRQLDSLVPAYCRTCDCCALH